MRIHNKSESLYYLEKLRLNHFTEEVFDPKGMFMMNRVREFLEENNQNLYVLRDPTRCSGNTYFNVSREEVLELVRQYTNKFSVAVSSRAYGKYVLIGDIYISRDLEEFWLIASDNPDYNTRMVLREPKWNISTYYYDKKIRNIPNIDKIIDYIFKKELFDMVVEFAVYLEKVGKYNEYVAIFELRTDY